MTNGQVNFVHDLVQMAKAFEELPQVREELNAATHRNSELSETIQRLELRIIDLKQELDAANARTAKAEVERDHAEQMFLETDDRLNAFQRLLRSFQTDASALVKAAEPAPAEQVSVPQAEAPTTPEPVAAEPAPATPATASGISVEFHGYATNVDSVSSGSQGSREVGEQTPTALSADNSGGMAQTAPNASETESGNIGEGVSVQPDPTPVSASSSESAWLGSNEANWQPERTLAVEDTAISGDPTANSPAGNTPTLGSAPTDAAADVADAPAACAPAEDDVGYHNEPRIAGSWEAWDDWCARMNAKYGPGRWPVRPTLAAQ